MNPAGVYVGRFAPSPTGPLHDGSVVAALASWLDARAHGGLWLLRLEDVDSTRCRPGLAQIIVQQLGDCGLVSDLPPVYQSQRHALYQAALDALVANGLAYPCGCTRQEIAAVRQQKIRHGELIYPGTCRSGLNGRPARAWRFDSGIYITNQPVAPVPIAQAAMQTAAVDAMQNNRQRSNIGHSRPSLHWHDRRLGAQQQEVAAEVGDFILRRADGCFAYQLAVVVDDAAQGITDVVRGQDLADNTARQILLQRALRLPTPRYLHTPLVLGHNGEKLSKQNGAQALDLSDPLRTLNRAATRLALPPHHGSLPQALQAWTAQWRNIHPAQRWSRPHTDG